MSSAGISRSPGSMAALSLAGGSPNRISIEPASRCTSSRTARSRASPAGSTSQAEEKPASPSSRMILPAADTPATCRPASRALANLTAAAEGVCPPSIGPVVPRKGGPGVTRSDLLVINKIDLAPHVGASLEVMDRDARLMRKQRPFVFTNMKSGEGVQTVADFIVERGGLA